MLNLNNIHFEKMGGLIPVCVQDAQTMQVLMLAFMNQEALTQTLESRLVTFYSRTKKRLWTKGETSGNVLEVVSLSVDCDQDALLILAKPKGPTCHKGEQSCFTDAPIAPLSALSTLVDTIDDRARQPKPESYTCKLFESGMARIAQKVGEEGVEVALAAVSGDAEAVLNESADLLFHLCVLLRARDLRMEEVCAVLTKRA